MQRAAEKLRALPHAGESVAGSVAVRRPIVIVGLDVFDRQTCAGLLERKVHIDAFRAHHPYPETARVCHGLVVIPTDSASSAQIEKYRAYAASRFERTKTPQGPRGMLFSPDYVGTSDELAETLYAHAGFQRADEVAFALPFTFDEQDYAQIVTDLAEKLGPKLGWTPNVGGER